MTTLLGNFRFVNTLETWIGNQPPDLDSETTIARSIAKGYEGVAKSIGMSEEPLISVDGVLWAYSADRGVWERIEHSELITLAQLFDGAYTADPGGKPKRIKIGFQRAGNISRSIYHLHELQAPNFFELNQKPGIAFTNGYATISEWGVELEDHSPENAATVAYDFELDEEAEPPEKWLEFLDSLFVKDRDKHAKINVLQEYIGGAIAGLSTTYQRCLLLLGTGANGKSLLGDLIAELLFPEGTTTFVSPRRWDKEYSLASLKDSMINIVGELPETNALDASAFKSIVAGDRIEARLPYQPPFYMRPRAAHIFSANEVPRTSDTSHGFMRRWIMLSFNENFENSPFRKNKEDFLKELEPEKAAIVYWALSGAARLIRTGGYTRLESHNEAIEDWRKESDGVFDFATSCLEFPSERVTPLREIRSAYEDWAGRVGRSTEISSKHLSKRLVKCGLTRKRVSTGTSIQCAIKPIAQWEDVSN